MADEEEVKKYVYEGARVQGETVEIASGEGDQRLTKEVVLDGARQGKGTATFPDGSVYEGEFSDGVRHGTGKYTYAAPPPGEDEEPKPPLGEYNGAWKEGRKEGIGIMVYANKAKYHGNWKDGKQDGTGTLYYPNGDIYTGSWHAGKKHGPGTYFFKETATKVTGVWDYNQLATGTFVDKFGNS